MRPQARLVPAPLLPFQHASPIAVSADGTEVARIVAGVLHVWTLADPAAPARTSARLPDCRGCRPP